ncbi:MAG: glycosyltransferase family 39 protein [Chloroflexi bacterium]|nr:glycosyltransferase family 39 protein [Chloroflexota bacterium]
MALSQRNALALMVAVLLLGAGVLMHSLTDTSLWADEGWTIAASGEDSPVEVISAWVADDVHPPLFFIGLWGWRQFTGDTLFEMRYYSVLLTLIGTAIMYRLGRAMFSPMAGILAALFYTLHDLVIVLTQEVRHYPQQMMLTALAMWLYWRFWERPTRSRGVAFALAGTALIYSHYWGGFVLLTLGLHALITHRHNFRPYLVANLAIGVLYAAWLPVIYHQITLERPNGLPHALDNSWVVYKTLTYQLVGIPEVFWLVLAVVGILGTFSTADRKCWRPTPASILPAAVIVLTVGLSLLLNTDYPSLSWRSLAVIIPSICLLAAHALAQFRWREQMVMVSFVLICALTTTSAGPVIRPPWPAMSDFLVTHSTRDDLILLELDTDEFAFDYYLDHSGADLRHVSTETKREANPAEFGVYLDQLLADETGVWVAKLDWPYYDIRGDLAARGFVPTATPITWPATVGRPIEAWRYDRPPQGEPWATFDDVLQLFHPVVDAHANQITVNMLWSPNAKPAWNYTVSVFLLNTEGGLACPTDCQHDSYPFENRSPTLGWESGGLYFDSHSLNIANLPAGRYQIGMKVYYFTDTNFTQLQIAPSSDCSANPACEYIIVDTLEIN